MSFGVKSYRKIYNGIIAAMNLVDPDGKIPFASIAKPASMNSVHGGRSLLRLNQITSVSQVSKLP